MVSLCLALETLTTLDLRNYQTAEMTSNIERSLAPDSRHVIVISGSY